MNDASEWGDDPEEELEPVPYVPTVMDAAL
ncbi:MAG: hypothetical protein JWP07_2952, partial [Pseudonocardiales bacterium]|nr:hypothetical protein [Pseudonocardiales bacterium]